MLKTLKYILQANEFLHLPRKMRRIVFYSEGKNYWPIFKGLVVGILNQSNLNICYLTSSKDDPGFKYSNKQFKSFLIDDSYVRNWLFENMQADVFILTMPDLNNYQLKRSKYPVHYIYVQHNLMSLHMSYRQGAFDWFDSVFCSGPHHVQEIRCLEETYNLPHKKILEHGYARLDSIIKNKQSGKVDNDLKHALFAPSWGNVSSLDSFHQSNFMISDWSGAALEYSFGLNKPVIFLDLPKKINNPLYKDINITPLEVSVRKEIGAVVNIDDITPSLIASLPYGQIDPNKYVFNIGKSDFYGVKYILNMAEDLYNNKSK